MSEAATYLADPRNDAIPLVRDVKRWITDELHKPLEEVEELGCDSPPTYTGADENGWMHFVPGRIMTVSVRFKDRELGVKNFNLNDYNIERKRTVGKPSKGTPADKRLKENKGKSTLPKVIAPPKKGK